MRQILIEDLMTTAVKCAAPSAPLSQVVESMRANRHSCIVIADNDTPVGIITERDIVKHFTDLMQNGRGYDPPATRIMSSPPVTIDAQASLIDALVVARSNEIRHLPVTSHDGKLVGLVTQTDLVAAHFRVVEAQIEVVDQAVADRTQVLVKANAKLRELMLEDPLLGTGNRRAMEIDLAHTHSAAQRYHRPYAVMLIDLDYFKLYNDHYGHPAGDKALQDIAAAIKQTIRKSDRIYRYGGEEILLLLPETDRKGAENLGQRMLEAVVQRAIPHARHQLGLLTISGGISFLSETDSNTSWNGLVKRADLALYQAKSAGRNRVATYYMTDSGVQAFAETVSAPANIDPYPIKPHAVPV